MKDTGLERLSVRINPMNPNHSIWNNNGTWFLHYTVHFGAMKARRRESLHTHDVNEARRRRDQRLAELRDPHPVPMPRPMAA